MYLSILRYRLERGLGLRESEMFASVEHILMELIEVEGYDEHLGSIVRNGSRLNRWIGTGVTKIVLLRLKSVPLTSRFVGTRGCIFNKGLLWIFHAILSVVETTTDLTHGSDSVHLSRLRWSKVSFHQALDLILELD
ncbi:hypothetical protein Tco_0565765 [Tanacetum coccineum]